MKKRLRLLAWVLSLAMLCQMLPFAAFAETSSTIGDDFSFEFAGGDGKREPTVLNIVAAVFDVAIGDCIISGQNRTSQSAVVAAILLDHLGDLLCSTGKLILSCIELPFKDGCKIVRIDHDTEIRVRCAVSVGIICLRSLDRIPQTFENICYIKSNLLQCSSRC